MSDLKWWCVDQNNSGGYFFEDNNVGTSVFFQGKSLDSIQDKIEDILREYRDYCDCCGERWDDDYLTENDGECGSLPTRYGKSIMSEECNLCWVGDGYILYYSDGRVSRYNPKDKTEVVLRLEWIEE